MHKGIMLIVKSKNRIEALNKTCKFLKEYKGSVWDWYQIGGRWTQTLAPIHNEFLKKTNAILEKEKGFLSQTEVEEKQSKLQALWEKFGGKGKNPYTDHYKLCDEGGYYDVMSLSDCIKIVKEWQQDPEKDGLEMLEEAKRWLKPKQEKNNWDMYGYALQKAANMFQQDFFFDTNVFNTEDHNFSIPKELKDYFVVMVDIHN